MGIKQVPTSLLSEAVLQAALKLLERHFNAKLNLCSVNFLSEAERRNVIARLSFNHSNNKLPRSIILKQSLPDKLDKDFDTAIARFSKDWAGLEFLSTLKNSALNVPKFYGGSKKHRFILIEDLGEEHISLVDSLTLPSKKNAIAALERFMTTLGKFHAVSFSHTNHFQKIIKKIDSNYQDLQIDLSNKLSEMIENLSIITKKFSLLITPEISNEIAQVVKSRFMSGPFTTLIHGDICPDNVFDSFQEKLQLIDFEWTYIGNALLDGTYLRMSMPTCWCAKRIPDNIIDHLEVIYRQELIRTIPTAANDLAYNTAYVEACAFWMLKTLNHINNVWDKEEIGSSGPVPGNSLWKNNENLVRPRILSRLQAFIDQANKHNMFPSLREMAEKILEKIKFLWPNAKPLEVYPAFMSKY